MYTVMIPAAGSGKRMGAGHNKLFLLLDGKPIFIRTLEVFEQDPSCAGIILAVREDEREIITEMLNKYGITKVKQLVDGGSERQHSVAACLEAHKDGGIVLVHDAARPFIRQSVIAKLVVVAKQHGAAIAAVRAKDTMKTAASGIVQDTLDREALWAIQTPQAFRDEVLRQASLNAQVEGFLGTDESMLVERFGHVVHVVESTYDNVKMTTPEDLVFGEFLLKERQQEER